MKLVHVSELFRVQYGVNLELNRLTLDPNGINFVSRTARNNGVSAKVRRLADVEPIKAGVLHGRRRRIGPRDVPPARTIL